MLRVDDGMDPKTGRRRHRTETFRGSKQQAEARLAEFLWLGAVLGLR